MSKTHRFNTTITLGSRSYPPGSEVPLGGKGGLSSEEAAKFEREFGPWTGKGKEPGRGGDQAGSADARAAFDKELQAVTAAFENEVTSLKDRVAELEEQLKLTASERDTLAGDNQILSERIEELEAASEKSNGGTA